MHLSVYLPLLFSGVFGVLAPPLARRLPPAAGTWLLSVGGLVAAAGSSTSLTLLAFTLAGQSSLLSSRGHWSVDSLRHVDPVATPVAAAALAALAILALEVGLVGWRRVLAVRDACRLAALLPAHGGELAVIPSPVPQAYAVPGRPGRIVVSTSLLRQLSAGERRAVLAHERSHLRHHHHVHQSLAQLAAAANPLLSRLPAAAGSACERWADEDAAKASNRDVVAEALTRAATSKPAAAASAVVLAAAATEITIRVAALRAAPLRLALWRLALLVGLLGATVAAVAEAAHDTERLFEFAQYAYRTQHR